MSELRYIERKEIVGYNAYKIITVLQQLLPVKNYNGHDLFAPNMEWVDVPTVKEDDE